jgi:phage shock protein C
MIAGVCGGVAEYFDIDPTLVRILSVVLVVVGFGVPVILYIIGAIIMPPDPAAKQGYVDAQAKPEPAPCEAPFAYQPKPVDNTGNPTAPPQDGNPAAQANSTTAQATESFAQSAYEPQQSGVPPHNPEPNPTANPTPNFNSNPNASQPPPPNPADRVTGAVKQHWSGALVLGAVLVGVGVLILLANLVNLSLWRFWPVILIVAGLVQLFTPSSKGWSLVRAGSAIALITVGIALLAWMFQIISGNAFVQCFFNLWPVLLVVAGLAIIGNAKKISAFNLAGSLLFSATLLWGLWFFGGINGTVNLVAPDGRAIAIDVPSSPTLAQHSADDDMPVLSKLKLDGATTASFTFEGGGASAAVVSSNEEDLLLRGNIAAPDKVEFFFDDASKSAAHLNMHNIINGSPVMVALPSSVLWDELTFDAGASYLVLDLSGLDVRNMVVHTGVSACDIVLDKPLASGSKLNISSGMAAVDLKLPGASSAIVQCTGINAVNCPDDSFTYNKYLKAWCSDEYIDKFGDELVEGEGVWTVSLTGLATLDLGTE